MAELNLPDRMARTARALDHAANVSPAPEVAAMFRVHQSTTVMMTTAVLYPERLEALADEWDRLCREIIRQAVEERLVDMTAHYQAERLRDG